ncbi:MAG: PAS domain S-box protein [Candidatus Nanopelagicales bacterium]
MSESIDHYRMLAENATDVVSLVSPDGNFVWISPSVEGLLGWRPEDMIAREAVTFMHDDDQAAGRETRTKIDAGQRVIQEIRVRRSDGSYRWVSAMGKQVCDEDGKPVGRAWGWRDIETEVKARQDLAASREKYRMLAENAADLVWQSNIEGVIRWVSPSVESVLGWKPEQMVGYQSLEFVDLLDHAEVLRLRAQVAHGKLISRHQARYRCADGQFRWMSTQARPVKDPSGQVMGFVVGLRDVHDQVLAQEALSRSERKFRLALDGAPQGMALVNLARQFTTVNDALCRMLGRDRDWLLDRTVGDLMSPEDSELDLIARDRQLAGEVDNNTRDVEFLRPDGQTLWVTHSTSLLRDEDGIPLFYVSQYQDITEARRIRSQLAYRAGHDQLTGLLNRSEFMSEIDRHLTRNTRTGNHIAVLFCDVDQFKAINDSSGHRAGDMVLVSIAERIRSTLRSDDVLGRLGGDEFVVLLHGVERPEDAVLTAEKIRAAVKPGVRIEGKEEPVVATLSIGIWVGDRSEDVDLMMTAADRALYRAKGAGRDRVVLDGEPIRLPADHPNLPVLPTQR